MADVSPSEPAHARHRGGHLLPAFELTIGNIRSLPRLTEHPFSDARPHSHGYKHGIMLGDYVANRVVGKDKQPELAETFRLKDRTF
jgi:hypothetical protein